MSHPAPLLAGVSCLEKVTAFITRGDAGARELLVFRHPHGSVQLPAGTVEEGEPPAEAALREVWEETGLAAVTIAEHLGAAPQPMRPDEVVVLHTVTMRQEPEAGAPEVIAGFPTYLGLRRGLYVRLLGHSDDARFVRIAYEEYDGPAHQWAGPSRSVAGWVPADSVTNRVVRHFYRIVPTEPAPDAWVQTAEEWEHRFELFWVPISGSSPVVPDLLPYQNGWLAEYGDRILAA